MNQHQFPKAVFPDDWETKELVQECLQCGLKRIKYRGGATAYINSSGNKTPVLPSGCVSGNKTPVLPSGCVSVGDKKLFDCMVLLRVATDELMEGRIKSMCKRFLETT